MTPRPPALSPVCVLVAAALWAGVAAAQPCPHPVAPASVCGQLAAAVELPPASPERLRVEGIWRRVVALVRAVSGRHTRLAVLGPDARMKDGTHFPPTARLCPGQPPVVYVPHALLDAVVGPSERYPVDFLAFVLGHELAHRISDLTHAGCNLPRSKRPASGAEAEHLADFRAAFFAAVAGFSTRRLANDGTVSAFLAAELAFERPAIATRRDALRQALADFDRYEDLYQASLSLAAVGEQEGAAAAIELAADAVRAAGVPLPELEIVRAITLLQLAAPSAAWRLVHRELALPTGQLRCTPVFPRHSALWQDVAGTKRLVPAQRAKGLLDKAAKALSDAARLGADPLTVAVARTCVALYRNDPDAAATQQSRAERLVRRAAPEAVRESVQANGTLIGLQRAALAVQTATADQTASGGKARTGAQHAALRRALEQAGATESAAGARARRQRAQCPSSRPPRVSSVRQAAPAVPGVRLALAVSRPAPGSTRLDDWRCGCPSVRRVGASNLGEVAWSVDCPAVASDRLLVWASPDGTVRRIVSVEAQLEH